MQTAHLSFPSYILITTSMSLNRKFFVALGTQILTADIVVFFFPHFLLRSPIIEYCVSFTPDFSNTKCVRKSTIHAVIIKQTNYSDFLNYLHSNMRVNSLHNFFPRQILHRTPSNRNWWQVPNFQFTNLSGRLRIQVVTHLPYPGLAIN